MLAAIGEVLAVLQQTQSKVAAEQRVAVGINAVPEVLAGHADLAAVAPCQLPPINEIPFLHTPLMQYSCATPGRAVGATGFRG